MKRIVIAASVIAGLTGCVVSQSEDQISFDGLVPVVNTNLDRAWVRPDFDLANYDKVMFRGVGIEYAPTKRATRLSVGTQTSFLIDEEDKQRLEDVVEDEFAKELVKVEGFETVDEPGQETLLLTIGLREVSSHVPPDRVGRHEVFLPEVGSATLVIEFRDSESGAIMVRGSERRAAERFGTDFQRSSPVTNWSTVRRLASTWARGLRVALDDLGAMAAQ